MKAYLELSRLTKAYPGPDGPSVIVKDFTLTVAKGEFVCLIGPSGCGKSTVLSMIAGLNDASGGGIILEDREVIEPGPDRGVVFQAPCLLPWLTALENVLLGVDQAFPDLARRERRRQAERYLELVGLLGALDRKPGELSAGTRQRVGIARAFALDPKLLLLDEPFSMLDSLTRLELQEALLDLWQRDQKTALMVTHDVDEALFLSDRVVMMTAGPAARIGGILSVGFERPRDRARLLEERSYARLREELIGFLEKQEESSDRDLGEARCLAPPVPAGGRASSADPAPTLPEAEMASVR
jgi:nitrate ABC transporter ATP-binding subunit